MSLLRVRHGGQGWAGLAPTAIVIAALSLLVRGVDAMPGQTVDQLLEDLSGADPARRAAAVKGLDKAGAAAAPRLARIVANATTDEVRAAALEALSRNSMAYAYSYVFWDELPADDSDDLRARRLAWDCLIRIGDAFIAVGEVGAASDHYCDLLESAVRPAERCMAIRGLGRASRRRAADTVFDALTDENALVRKAALAAVADLRWGQARPHLERTLETAGPALLAGLLGSLSRRAEPEAAAMVERFLNHEAPVVRAAARKAHARHSGYVTDWWVLGALSDADLEEGVVPIAKLAPRERPDVKVGARTVKWRRVVASGSNGVVDLTRAPDSKGSATAYICAEIVTAKARSAHLSVDVQGVDRPACWLNGRPIPVAGETIKPDAAAVAEITLAAGTNRLLVRVDGSAPRFCLRVTDGAGRPIILAPPTGRPRE